MANFGYVAACLATVLLAGCEQPGSHAMPIEMRVAPTPEQERAEQEKGLLIFKAPDTGCRVWKLSYTQPIYYSECPGHLIVKPDEHVTVSVEEPL
jgi:hypothetical protein